MKIPREYQNVRIVAKKSYYEGFDIYLEFSGQREFLMGYNYNGLLFDYLKNGRWLSEFYRWHPKKMRPRKGQKMVSSMAFVRRRIEEALSERIRVNQYG